MSTFARTPKQNFVLILTLGILNALTPFTIDMYLPSFAQISGDLGVSVARVALSVSIYFIGFALGQVIYGPLLDRFGRKPPLYFGLALYSLANIGCMQSTTLTQLLVFRFLSAMGGCAASVGATAMVRDFFPPEAATKVFSLLMLVLSASPMLAPTIGGFLVEVATWRTIFAILAGLGVVNFLLVAWVLPKAYQPDTSVSLRLRPILRNFGDALAVREFSTNVFAGSFALAGLFVYIAASPTVFMTDFAVPPRYYGVIFAILAVGMIGGGQLNLLLLSKFRSEKILRAALCFELFWSAAFLLAVLADVANLYATIGFLFLILLSTGIGYPNAASLALAPFTKNIGSAAALLGFFQLGVGALVSAGIGLLDMKGSLATALAITFSAGVGVTILFLFPKSHQIASIPQDTSANQV